MKALQTLFVFAVGVVLALALGFAELTRPEHILGWVDVRHWDPSLLFVMLGATSAYAIAHRIALRRERAQLCRLDLPTRTAVDAKLLVGASIFGTGWAIGGVCPGPAFTTLGGGQSWIVAFILPMFVGLWLGAPHRLGQGLGWFRRRERSVAVLP
ncbi:MAG: YeeE/YedE family protein [Polyangiaceae bacterium]|nr:YeeE/YedE family protein [Myxococcales bacterium]MCB9586142.1 YeeE/YedE family protein [Polyangiaceae bacterium]MCB9606820.1 YeeE/YedE family protein [Polyangiaceae bacterium]